MAKYTITYDEDVKGFTSFHSFFPDWMGSMNGNFYSVKDGQLYIHNDETNALRNNFYGSQYESSVVAIVNESPSDIKVIKAVDTESNKAFDVEVKSYLNDETLSVTESAIDTTEFENREGKWYAYVRKNELTGDFTAHSVYGIGRSTTGPPSTTIIMEGDIPTLTSVGDAVYNESEVFVANIINIDRVLNTIEFDNSVVLAPSTFIYGVKTARVEGSEIRGYNFEITLTDNTTTDTTLFALNSEVFKSFTS